MSVNAKIESTHLGFEDHGIMTFWITLNYGGSHQGFGGYALDNPQDGKRVPTVLVGHAVQRILKVVGVSKWEDLKGKYVRVKRTEVGATAIGNILENEWFDPSEEFQAIIGEASE